MTCKIVTIVGARPQFIKAAAVSREILKHPGRLEEVIVHTGQHYDPNMSQVFFDELEIPLPKYNLEISGGGHGAMTGRMLEGIEQILLDERPDWVLIYGDTNSTLAGALAAAKLHIPVAHVEAGLRSFNMHMPEEINRILADRVSTLLLCPTEIAMRNLADEGIRKGVSNVGDVMYDVSLYFRGLAARRSTILAHLGLTSSRYVLATCHRAENTDDPARLREIVAGLQGIARKTTVVLPLHPRTRQALVSQQLLCSLEGVVLTEPLPFLDMISLELSAAAIVTDSGGVQKEAFFFQVPCITVRDETEWVESVDLGWNTLVGASQVRIVDAFDNLSGGTPNVFPYGDGAAAGKIVHAILTN
ncbi:UDP-N-acetylglucosamine 2-epimerase (non-hydrolyzing) [Pseudomonas sp. LS44]|uniref:non-hydrolyzing UDP-N-acetylglucosamine 2-epimerase n=1 Tax=Pseudomonas sp. LS44 TaxID=1357074 RepID=UPI00215A6043|nr:UDP-N-acetylglucosamine 2-epimerase (non-hydrolyzing) [Pseudomonas sp. LS44]UVE19033.1 UDP-N-acetylglucosamine 2-epimerase (non-hydrolyzing) [Pseudomonas sp. LS44]